VLLPMDRPSMACVDPSGFTTLMEVGDTCRGRHLLHC
jgi:hypothetical protein